MRPEIQSRVLAALAATAEETADAFYDEMMSVDGADRFLASELVDSRLRASMADWVRELLVPRNEDQEVAFRERQDQIGLVHSRVGVPMSLVARGMTILKREFAHRIEKVIEDRAALLETLLETNARLDEALSRINQSYLSHALTNERNDQSMRLQIISHNLAVECERLRSALSNWMRKRLLSLYGDDSATLIMANPVRNSEVGLWITHKAELLFPDMCETVELGEQLAAIDAALAEAVESRESPALLESVTKLDEAVNRAAWLLGALVEHALEGERTLDPLTRVMSRRYLPGVMQREVKISLRHDAPFAVLMIDADHFKQLNDAYGHAAGDKALITLSEVLQSTLRANDFVFRYGGEEFLAVLSQITADNALAVAEKLRAGIEERVFETGEGSTKLTVSIGIALHDGHPDYQRVIDRADDALLRAKTEGRNRCTLAPL
jgi:diguanylate cyclase